MAVNKQENQDKTAIESNRALINEYCTYCHNDSLVEGGLSWSEVKKNIPEFLS